MTYRVQRGDTIAKVTRLLKTDWKTLSRLNPQAVGRCSRTNNWFLKEGATIKSEKPFETVLKQTEVKNKLSFEKNLTNSEKWVKYTIKSGAAPLTCRYTSSG